MKKLEKLTILTNTGIGDVYPRHETCAEKINELVESYNLMVDHLNSSQEGERNFTSKEFGIAGKVKFINGQQVVEGLDYRIDGLTLTILNKDLLSKNN